MAEMRAADRSGFLGALADLLMGAQGGLNALGTIPQAVPLVGGQGAGDLAFGGGPALLDNMSYGFSPIRGAGMAATLDPAVMDLLALMPGVGRAAGVARDLPGVIRRAAFDAYSPATHVARPRYMLGGREVPKEVVQAEFGIASDTPATAPRKRKYAYTPVEPERATVPNRYTLHGVEVPESRLFKEFFPWSMDVPIPMLPRPPVKLPGELSKPLVLTTPVEAGPLGFALGGREMSREEMLALIQQRGAQINPLLSPSDYAAQFSATKRW